MKQTIGKLKAGLGRTVLFAVLTGSLMLFSSTGALAEKDPACVAAAESTYDAAVELAIGLDVVCLAGAALTCEAPPVCAALGVLCADALALQEYNAQQNYDIAVKACPDVCPNPLGPLSMNKPRRINNSNTMSLTRDSEQT